jgi:hypothetical protein
MAPPTFRPVWSVLRLSIVRNRPLSWAIIDLFRSSRRNCGSCGSPDDLGEGGACLLWGAKVERRLRVVLHRQLVAPAGGEQDVDVGRAVGEGRRRVQGYSRVGDDWVEVLPHEVDVHRAGEHSVRGEQIEHRRAECTRRPGTQNSLRSRTLGQRTKRFGRCRRRPGHVLRSVHRSRRPVRARTG